jgi:hypothetical protein
LGGGGEELGDVDLASSDIGEPKNFEPIAEETFTGVDGSNFFGSGVIVVEPAVFAVGGDNNMEFGSALLDDEP